MAKAKWFKGNIHTHTTESDGDAEPEKVVSWYRRHGYDFLVLSDHNHLTLLRYAAGKRRFRRPLMIPGEELSARIEVQQRTVPIHINGIGISRVVEPINAEDIVPTIQANVDAIREAGGIASINHPNFKWAFGHEEISRIEGASLLEVYNGHPATNSDGGAGKASADEIWDGVLSANRVIFGVATDDSHRYHDFTPMMSNPGRGWVIVRATEFSQDAIVDSMRVGDFYSSTGVTLSDLNSSHDGVFLRIEQDNDAVYTTRFIGRGGTTLAKVNGLEAAYEPRGDEGYVRATVRGSTPGARAWTQPVFLNS